ncbi:hypothetical protein WR25_15270 isoform B [Diploscapter pachys]|uniref:Uncharacterized protein n=1 Tax=Diploscapter pachys TaxID=2018661 RepID=A0A2A2KFU4_9BILA|nr:hypothetical protein WR25_15270 isoform B [Diploscapter pachys]
MFLNLKNSKQVSESFQCNFCKKINKIKKFQLMWAKSLEGLTCSVPARMGDKSDVERDEYIEESLQLAGRLTKICDAMSDRGVAAHICSTVHHPAQMGVYGQKASKEKLAENLLLNYDPNQPMIQVRKSKDKLFLSKQKQEQLILPKIKSFFFFLNQKHYFKIEKKTQF